ncbi:MAG: hypothetical protein ACREC0_00500 [Methylocella sp.]
MSKRKQGSFAATLEVKKLKDEDGNKTFTIRLARIVLGKTKKGAEISTLIVESIEVTPAGDGAARSNIATRDKSEPQWKIIRDECLETYDRVAGVVEEKRRETGGEKTLGLNFKPVIKVPEDAIRDDLKSRGFLTKNSTGGLTDAARTAFKNAKVGLIRGGEFVEQDDLIWRP